MKRQVILALMATICGLSLWAGDPTPETLKAELASVESQILELIRQQAAAPEVRALRDAMMAAQKAQDAIAKALPEIKELDAQIAKLRTQLAALQRQRQELTQKSAEAAVARQAVETARQAYDAATTERPEMRTLRERRLQILRQLAGNAATAEGK